MKQATLFIEVQNQGTFFLGGIPRRPNPQIFVLNEQ